MAEAPAAEAKEFSAEIKSLAERIVSLNLTQAQELVDCLKQEHGIEPAGGGVVMAVGPDEAAEEAKEEQIAFDVVLTGHGDKKIQVIKVVRAHTSLGLKEAKDLVDAAPKAVKEQISKEEAEKIKAEIEGAGGTVEIK